MKILGMNVPDEVAKAIVAKAKTEELFKEFFQEMEWRWKFLGKDKDVHRAIESQKKSYPGCQIAFKIKYDADGYFEMESSDRPDDNGIVTIVIAYDDSCSLRKIHEKLFDHIRKTYQIGFAEYFPTLYLEEPIIDIKCKAGQHLDDLIEDINERIPEVTANRVEGDVIRIKMN